jgi:hypothetical protein
MIFYLLSRQMRTHAFGQEWPKVQDPLFITDGERRQFFRVDSNYYFPLSEESPQAFTGLKTQFVNALNLDPQFFGDAFVIEGQSSQPEVLKLFY